MQSMKKQGFSLIELMVAVAIVGILAGLALPGYRTMVMESQRKTAISNLLKLQVCYEAEYAKNNAFPTNSTACPMPASTNYYSYSAPTQTTSTYTVRATALNAQVNDKADDGTACTTLNIDQTGAQSPAACWN